MNGASSHLERFERGSRFGQICCPYFFGGNNVIESEEMIMMKVFNKGIRTFLLLSTDGKTTMKLEPSKFPEIPAEFQGDPTLKMAMAAGEVVQYDTISQADAIEKAAKSTPDEALEVGKRTRKSAAKE